MLLYLILVSRGILKVYKFCVECRWFEWPPFLLDLFYGLLHTGLLFFILLEVRLVVLET